MLLCIGRSSLEGRFACEDRAMAAMTYMYKHTQTNIHGQTYTDKHTQTKIHIVLVCTATSVRHVYVTES